MDIKNIVSIRSQGLNGFIKENMSPEDVIFHVTNGCIGISLVPFKGDFPPSYKYSVRKQVLQKILEGTLSGEVARANEVFYCSYDTIYSVDYIFHVDNGSRSVTLYIIRDSVIIRRYQNYKLNYDERIDLANI